MVENWFDIFNRAIEDYHLLDDVNQSMPSAYPQGSESFLLYKKCWIDTVQWHLEDIVRDPEIDPEKGMKIKREIDASNQRRTDLVEQLDDHFINVLQLPEVPPASARLNTESLAWALDRLSILALKIYHMEIEFERAQGDRKTFLEAKRSILLAQKADLFHSINALIEDVKLGRRYYKVYRQVKMYNDPSLNPVLYKNTKS
ncbi:MAG: DUF4254 domain-containing protein [Cryomorphaceae bacterium]|nr:DUF4254 domain-containing protein [Cryomorphaceae bacterium]